MEEKNQEAPANAEAPKQEEKKERDDLMLIQDFAKFNIVVAQIKEVREHPNADRLYVLKVDTGSDVRQIVAGIRNEYTIEQLVDRKIFLIENLKPAVIRGEESNGMLLAVADDKGTTLVSLERDDIALGSRVR